MGGRGGRKKEKGRRRREEEGRGKGMEKGREEKGQRREVRGRTPIAFWTNRTLL